MTLPVLMLGLLPDVDSPTRKGGGVCHVDLPGTEF